MDPSNASTVFGIPRQENDIWTNIKEVHVGVPGGLSAQRGSALDDSVRIASSDLEFAAKQSRCPPLKSVPTQASEVRRPPRSDTKPGGKELALGLAQSRIVASDGYEAESEISDGEREVANERDDFRETQERDVPCRECDSLAYRFVVGMKADSRQFPADRSFRSASP